MLAMFANNNRKGQFASASAESLGASVDRMYENRCIGGYRMQLLDPSSMHIE
ncbi:hypothetical protein [Novipirellula rosea]|uniref:hypothetical protein n=1 Tax=Novipirellula rosea TaxID=1031540 RepID=UPI0031EF225F